MILHLTVQHGDQKEYRIYPITANALESKQMERFLLLRKFPKINAFIWLSLVVSEELGGTAHFRCAQSVTESKLVLLTAGQANKSRGEVLGQGIATLFGKTTDQEDGGLVSQRTILPRFGC